MLTRPFPASKMRASSILSRNAAVPGCFLLPPHWNHKPNCTLCPLLKTFLLAKNGGYIMWLLLKRYIPMMAASWLITSGVMHVTDGYMVFRRPSDHEQVLFRESTSSDIAAIATMKANAATGAFLGAAPNSMQACQYRYVFIGSKLRKLCSRICS